MGYWGLAQGEAVGDFDKVFSQDVQIGKNETGKLSPASHQCYYDTYQSAGKKLSHQAHKLFCLIIRLLRIFSSENPLVLIVSFKPQPLHSSKIFLELFVQQTRLYIVEAKQANGAQVTLGDDIFFTRQAVAASSMA